MLPRRALAPLLGHHPTGDIVARRAELVDRRETVF